MKKLFFLLLLISQIIFGQSNIVKISTTGSGESKEEAVQNAIGNTIYNSNSEVKYDGYTLILQTNLSFDQSMIIKSYFTLEDHKKFRGFQISNSN